MSLCARHYLLESVMLFYCWDKYLREATQGRKSGYLGSWFEGGEGVAVGTS